LGLATSLVLTTCFYEDIVCKLLESTRQMKQMDEGSRRIGMRIPTKLVFCTTTFWAQLWKKY